MFPSGLQVEENIALFMHSLVEAVVLVVVIAFIGFWEWRSAAMLAVSIPLTLAMTFGMMSVLGIDLQQISIASLIVALGLLVDDPVVAGDAIKRELDHGHPPVVAAWLGPIKLGRAIMFATVTDIVAYLPLLLLSGATGQFLVSLPIVLTCSLVASRLVSMTFIPLLGYYLLRPSKKPAAPIHVRREHGFAGWYYKVGRWAIEHRWRVALASLGVLVLGGVIMKRLKPQYFPKDLQYLSYATCPDAAFTMKIWFSGLFLPRAASGSASTTRRPRSNRLPNDIGNTPRVAHSSGAC